MITILAGSAAALAAFVAFAYLFGAKRSLVTSGIAGFIAGYLAGYALASAVRVLHFFSPASIPNPIIQISGVAMGLNLLYPPIAAIAGLTFGCFLVRLFDVC